MMIVARVWMPYALHVVQMLRCEEGKMSIVIAESVHIILKTGDVLRDYGDFVGCATWSPAPSQPCGSQSFQTVGYYLDRVAHHFGKEFGRVRDFVADALDETESERTVIEYAQRTVLLAVVDRKQSIDQCRRSSLYG